VGGGVEDGGDDAVGGVGLEVGDVGDDDELAARAGQADVEEVRGVGVGAAAGEQDAGAQGGGVDEVDDDDVALAALEAVDGAALDVGDAESGFTREAPFAARWQVVREAVSTTISGWSG
jgi:hypothetical protein